MIRFRNIALVVAALGAATYLGYALGQKSGSTSAGLEAKNSTERTASKERKILYYRNPMGLPDTSPTPKKDPMGMDYVPVYEGEAETKEASGTVQISPERVQILGVRTEAASRRNLARNIRARGTIQADETRQSVIAPRFEGWVEKLYVNATGQKVQTGDPLLSFYSPEIVNIEAEYPFSLESNSGGKGKKNNGTIAKLQRLDVPQAEIDRLRKEHTESSHIILRAPADGTVMEKQAVEGMKFAAGDTLYKIVDLSNIWVIANVYEQDLSQIALEQPVTIKASAIPGKTFEAKVAFIYPNINPDTRTAKVRLELPNPTGDLRIDMFVDAELSGPEAKDVLSIPTSAILNSGERKTVLIDLGEGKFRPQAVKTGAEGEGSIEILDGLKEGDRVVTDASFLIDAESSIRAAMQNFAPSEKSR
jgi:Cu(I)/Ag(I) efflux system membrane fusion protein